ncbi:MAG: hypothetical protein VYB74_01655, partial [Cyanobacteriota bacterium]|nr:hypothetical protein [Cyanobacteriota bacterium]
MGSTSDMRGRFTDGGPSAAAGLSAAAGAALSATLKIIIAGSAEPEAAPLGRLPGGACPGTASPTGVGADFAGAGWSAGSFSAGSASTGAGAGSAFPAFPGGCAGSASADAAFPGGCAGSAFPGLDMLASGLSATAAAGWSAGAVSAGAGWRSASSTGVLAACCPAGVASSPTGSAELEAALLGKLPG